MMGKWVLLIFLFSAKGQPYVALDPTTHRAAKFATEQACNYMGQWMLQTETEGMTIGKIPPMTFGSRFECHQQGPEVP